MMPLRPLVLLAAAGLGLSGCAGDVDAPLFEALAPEATGLDFENRIVETEEGNVFTYRNFFNGGGVGVGDVDGDGRPDLYLTANQGPNRLYLNRTEPGGAIRFEDVTDAAGVAGTRAWSTGVSVADVDGDGRLDLYVSNAGTTAGEDRANELFRNLGPGPDGVPRFEEVAEAWGVADDGTSTHGAFFDADADGDLDLYVLNNSFRPVASFGLRNIRDERHPTGGDVLYRNDAAPGEAPRFVDVSEAAGIYGSEIAFGLGVTLGDVDDDGRLDVYVSNDFFERDYLYLNRGDGTFDEVLEDAMPSTSLFSMGADMADLTGDGRPEVFAVDMLPWDDDRLKATSSYEGHNLYRAKLANGYHHQVMRNALHRNNADGTFSEIGAVAGIEATDWSWAALFADLDLDARADLYVTNGILRDVTDQDYIAFLANTQSQEALATGRGVDYLELSKIMPSTPLENRAFANVSAGDSVAFRLAPEWGLNEAAFSNGAATADFDGDGDLDVVVNNVNAPVSFYLNHAAERHPERAALAVALEGEGANTGGIGAKVAVWTDGAVQVREAVPTRGFQSSVDPVLHVGLGEAEAADSVVVRWPSGRVQALADVPAGRVTLREADAEEAFRPLVAPMPTAGPFREVAGLPEWAHSENATVDFDRELLLPRGYSEDGPAAAVGDVDGDGADDLFLGGAAGQPGVLWLRRGAGLEQVEPAAFAADAASEDVAAAFFDADGDGALDLYVASGGYAVEASDVALVDRLYLGDGAGGFERAPDGAIPTTTASTGTVAAADWDGDGDTDLFVGGRVVPGAYGVSPRSTLLRNDTRSGSGTGSQPGAPRLVDVTRGVAPGLDEAGLLTGAVFADVDGDGDPDLVTAGEWRPVTVWTNDGGRFTPSPLDGTSGLWQTLAVADLDGDGDADLVGGNWGLNSRFRASATEPMRLHVGDFDRNGRIDPLISVYNRGRSLPFALRNELTAQLPSLKREYLQPSTYVGQTVEDLLTPAELDRADVFEVAELATVILWNDGGAWRAQRLPFEAQLAPMTAALATDADGDGALDLLLGGNRDALKPDLGRLAASRGVFLRGDGQGGFEAVPGVASGFRVPGETRQLVRLDGPGGAVLVVVRNDAAPIVFSLAPDAIAVR